MNRPRTNAGTDQVEPGGATRAPKRRRLQLGLTGRMFLLVVIAVLPALVIQGVNEYTLRSSREDDIRERVIQITKQFGEEMKEVREGASQLLIALGELDEVQTHNTQECSAILAKLKARFDSYAYLGAADADGKVFCSSRPEVIPSVAQTEFFKRALNDNDLAVGNYFVDPKTQEKLIHFAHRFQKSDGSPGVVFAALDLAWLSEHLKERGLTPSQSILIADRLGNIIARLPHPEQLVGKNMRKSHEAIMDGDTAGWEEAKGVDNITRIFGYVPVALPPKDFFLSAGQSKVEAFEPIDAATKRGILLILLGLLAASYLAWIGGRKFIQRPISELLEVTGEWEKGNYDARVNVEDEATEIGRLGLAFNKMADALATRHAAQQRAEEQLRHLNATLESRIERRTIELEEANRAKSQFLAKMSHEIRTPVNGVLGMLELLVQTKLGPTQRRYIDTARRSAEALLGIINGILDISKIEAGKVELDVAEFDLRDLVEEVTETFTDIAYGKGLELTCSMPADLPTAVVGDAGRLRQILTNLVGNAIKFTDKGEVGVRVEPIQIDRDSAFVAFEVSDTGIGIAPDKQEHIFDAFAQADSSTTRRYGGTGLGLTIAKQLCEMMGGSIELKSEPGRGSIFRFTARLERQSGAAPAGSAAPPFGGRRALVVKPDTLTRRNLKEQLLSWGIQVSEAESSTGALAEMLAAASNGDPFALVVIDVARPVMNGIALARTILSDPAMADVRLLLLSSREQESEGVGDLRGSGIGWLTKPVRQSALRACLAAIEGTGQVTPEISVHQAVIPEGIAGARVLLVEDNPVNLEVAVGILETFGCDVETATNGREALDCYETGEYGLVFMDCQMPEMDGFEATAEIRKREAQSGTRIPIVALTASAIEGDRERCLAAGMDDYLAKPFTAEQMKTALVTWLGPATRGTAAVSAKREHLTLVTSAPPAPPTPPPAPVVDTTDVEPIDDSVLNALAQLQREGRPDIVNRVITLFLESAPALLKDLEQGVAKGDTALLHRASHTLKSASANVGAALLSTRCRELEMLARSGSVPDAAARVETIVGDYQRAKSALTARLPRVA